MHYCARKSIRWVIAWRIWIDYFAVSSHFKLSSCGLLKPSVLHCACRIPSIRHLLRSLHLIMINCLVCLYDNVNMFSAHVVLTSPCTVLLIKLNMQIATGQDFKTTTRYIKKIMPWNPTANRNFIVSTAEVIDCWFNIWKPAYFTQYSGRSGYFTSQNRCSIMYLSSSKITTLYKKKLATGSEKYLKT